MTSSSTSTLATTLGLPPSQKLTRENFWFWKALVMSSLRGAMVLGLLDGTDATPAPNIEAEDSDKKKVIIPNPCYAIWISRDQHVLNYIVNSLSPGILTHVLEKEITFEVWSTITSMFSSMYRSKVSHLRTTLNNTKKKEMTVA
jgi:hypothetical protein